MEMVFLIFLWEAPTMIPQNYLYSRRTEALYKSQNLFLLRIKTMKILAPFFSMRITTAIWILLWFQEEIRTNWAHQTFSHVYTLTMGKAILHVVSMAGLRFQ